MEHKKHETVFMAPSHKQNENVCVAIQTSHSPNTADFCITGVHRRITPLPVSKATSDVNLAPASLDSLSVA
jgi:hypothetical protein